MDIQKIIKNKKLLFAGIPMLLLILLMILLLCLNRYTLELDVEEGQIFQVEYGEKNALPEVNAIYKGTIFNRKGTEVDVTLEGVIPEQELGTFQLLCKAEYKHKRAEANITLVIEDHKKPIIELTADPEKFTKPGAVYEEEGFTAIDNFDGDITDKVVREEKDGIVTYKVTDSSGNVCEVRRTIAYKDVVAPVITLNGGEAITVGIGADYTEPGYQALDDCDGDITANVAVEGIVNGHQAGIYTLIYRVKDAYENICEVTRTVTVADITKPVLNLTGNSNMYIKLGEAYIEPGYTATDNVDGDITANVVVSGGVDIWAQGNYTLTYQITDNAGNTTTVTRSVYVFEKQAQMNEIHPGDKVVYLTFDDGPGVHTARLLDILDKYGVKATFFVSHQYPAYQNLIGESYRRGHTIALHTFSHRYQDLYASEAAYYEDLSKINDICVTETGVAPKIVRFPGGGGNTISRRYCPGLMSTLVQSLPYHGYVYCDWNVSSGDAGGVSTADAVANNVISGIKRHNVSVVLQHDIKGFSVDAVERILAWGLANGYTFLPMSETSPMVHHPVNN